LQDISSFATTHEFYLAVANDLIHRARVATAQGLRQKLVRFGMPPFEAKKGLTACLGTCYTTKNQVFGGVAQLVRAWDA